MLTVYSKQKGSFCKASFLLSFIFDLVCIFAAIWKFVDFKFYHELASHSLIEIVLIGKRYE